MVSQRDIKIKQEPSVFLHKTENAFNEISILYPTKYYRILLMKTTIV